MFVRNIVQKKKYTWTSKLRRIISSWRNKFFFFFFFNAKIKKIGFYRLPDCRRPLRYWDSSSRFSAALSIGGFSLTDSPDRSRRKVRVSGITEKKFYDIEVATMHKLRASFGCNMFRRFLLSSPAPPSSDAFIQIKGCYETMDRRFSEMAWSFEYDPRYRMLTFYNICEPPENHVDRIYQSKCGGKLNSPPLFFNVRVTEDGPILTYTDISCLYFRSYHAFIYVYYSLSYRAIWNFLL